VLTEFFPKVPETYISLDRLNSCVGPGDEIIQNLLNVLAGSRSRITIFAVIGGYFDPKDIVSRETMERLAVIVKDQHRV
jgi:hypothetical protein